MITLSGVCVKEQIQENTHKNEYILKYIRFKARSENKYVWNKSNCTVSATVPASMGETKKIGALDFIAFCICH